MHWGRWEFLQGGDISAVWDSVARGGQGYRVVQVSPSRGGSHVSSQCLHPCALQLPSWAVPRLCPAPEQYHQNMISTSTISLLTLSSGSALCISFPCVRVSCVLIQSPSSLPEIPITLVCLYPTVVQCTSGVLLLFLQFRM